MTKEEPFALRNRELASGKCRSQGYVLESILRSKRLHQYKQRDTVLTISPDLSVMIIASSKYDRPRSYLFRRFLRLLAILQRLMWITEGYSPLMWTNHFRQVDAFSA